MTQRVSLRDALEPPSRDAVVRAGESVLERLGVCRKHLSGTEADRALIAACTLVGAAGRGEHERWVSMRGLLALDGLLDAIERLIVDLLDDREPEAVDPPRSGGSEEPQG